MSDGVYWNYLPKSPRRRLTVVEYLLLASLLAIAVRVALPFGQRALHDRAFAEMARSITEVERAARAAAASGDFEAVEDAEAGTIPTGMDNYLPEGFEFERGTWRLDWDHFAAHDRLQEGMVGELHGVITVEIDDPALRDHFVREAGRRVWLEEGARVSIWVPDLTGTRDAAGL